jgi:osmotically-inducible protein OsmY
VNSRSAQSTGDFVAETEKLRNGKNVKIITNYGTVTLRGPVKSEKEKADIAAKAQQIAEKGVP